MISRRLLLAEVIALVARNDRKIERRILAEANDVRRSRGLRELRWHESVAEVAGSHSRRMAEAKFFSHVDPERGDLQKRLKAAGIEWTAIAENIYQQRGYDDPVGRAVAAWLDSEGHRRNILNPTYTDSGVGVATRADGTFYCTQIFIRS